MIPFPKPNRLFIKIPETNMLLSIVHDYLDLHNIPHNDSYTWGWCDSCNALTLAKKSIKQTEYMTDAIYYTSRYNLRTLKKIKQRPTGAFLTAQILGSSNELRLVASRTPEVALAYAEHIDKAPHEVTRNGVIADPSLSLSYAKYVDKKPTRYTWNAVQSWGTYSEKYLKTFNLTFDEARKL